MAYQVIYAGKPLHNYMDIHKINRTILPSRENSSKIIPSRHGSYYTSYKYAEKEISLECELLDIENYNEAIRNINNWLNDIEDNRLFFLNNPSKCYKVKKVTTGNIKNELHIYGAFTIEFTCSSSKVLFSTFPIKVLNSFIFLGIH